MIIIHFAFLNDNHSEAKKQQNMIIIQKKYYFWMIIIHFWMIIIHFTMIMKENHWLSFIFGEWLLFTKMSVWMIIIHFLYEFWIHVSNESLPRSPLFYFLIWNKMYQIMRIMLEIFFLHHAKDMYLHFKI